MIKDTDEKAPADPQKQRAAEGRSPVHGGEARGGHDMFFAAVRMSPVPMCLSDPNRPDNPLVFVNRAFEDLTGYPEEEILGRNCRFLQGPETDQAVAAEVGRSIAAGMDVSAELYNYRKDGSGFWSALHLSPVFGDAGDLLHFFGSQLDVTKRRQAEAAMQRLQPLGSVAAGIAQELDGLAAGATGSPEQARANPGGGLHAPQLAHAAWGAEQARRAAAAAAPGGALVLRPVRVDTQGEDEEGCLVFSGGRLVAVLVRLSGQHGALAGRWHLEHGFGMLDGPEHPSFASLDAARGWVGRRLGRTGSGDP